MELMNITLKISPLGSKSDPFLNQKRRRKLSQNLTQSGANLTQIGSNWMHIGSFLGDSTANNFAAPASGGRRAPCARATATGPMRDIRLVRYLRVPTKGRVPVGTKFRITGYRITIFDRFNKFRSRICMVPRGT